MPRSTSTSPQSSAYNPYGNNHSYPPAPYGDPRSLPSTNPPGWLSTTSGPPPQVIETKTRSGLRNRNATESASSQPLPSPGLAGPSGGAKANTPSEFVKKLFRMLSDTSYSDVVGWGSAGTSFLVKDMNQFTTRILPSQFRHSNFASFVRQLNKYDFHKVQRPKGESAAGGDGIWEFKHPHFHRNAGNSLENIRRKGPAPKKSGSSAKKEDGSPDPDDRGSASPPPTSSGLLPNPHSQPGFFGNSYEPSIDPNEFQRLQNQVQVLQQSQTTMFQHVQTLHAKYQKIISDLVTLQRSTTSTEALVGDVVNYLVRLENSEPNSTGTNGFASRAQHNPSSGTTNLLSSSSSLQQQQHPQPSYGSNLPPNQSDASSSHQNQNQQRNQHSTHQTNNKGKEREGEIPRNDSLVQGWSGGGDGGLVNGGVRGGGGGFGNDHFQTLAPFQHANPNPSQLNYSTYTPNSAPPTQTNFPPLYNASHAPQPTYLPYGNPSNPQDAYQHQSNGPFDGASQADFMGGAIFGERTDSSGVRLLTVGQLVPREAQQHVEQSADQHSLTYSFDNNRYGDSSWANPLPNSHPRPHDYVSPKESDTPGGDSPHSSRTKPIGSADTTTVASGPSSDSPFGTLELPSASSRPPNTVRVRRSTYVPGWSAPPRVLVVDDDSVNAKLSSKFLEVFGCTTDVAVDGIGAVNKMNLEKYDLVLMDIVMAPLDGVSATSIIRQFDPITPIISMTSNSSPEDLLAYMSSGMNGHLSKPFNKPQFLEMLEKHLNHMSTTKSKPEDGPAFQGVLEQVYQSHGSDGHEGMLRDDQYMSMLQSLVTAGPDGFDDETYGTLEGSSSSAVKRPHSTENQEGEKRARRFEELDS